MREIKFTPERQEIKQEIKKEESKIEKLAINDFAREIGLQPDAQGRYTFGPEHVREAFEYAERFVREKKQKELLLMVLLHLQ